MIRFFAFLAAAVVVVAQSVSAQVLDATVSGELADVKGVARFAGEYHLWNLGDGEKTIPRAVWQGAFDRVAKGEDVWLDIEPDLSSNANWRRPIDPSKAPLAKVKATHEAVASQLAPLCKLAERTGSRVWLYGLLSPTYTRNEDIVNDSRTWREDTDALHKLPIAAMLHATGGGVIYEVYIPDNWNRKDGWAVAKCVLLLERQATALEANGLRGIPLINLNTITGKPLQTETARAIIFAAKSRGRVAVWNGFGGGDGFAKFTSEQKELLK